MTSTSGQPAISRRTVLGAAAAAPLLTAFPAIRGAAAPSHDHQYPHNQFLPTPHDCLRDVHKMVDFGPRYTGSKSHNDYIGWLHESIERPGGKVLPYDHHPCDLWLAKKYGLTILEGAAAGHVPVASYYPRAGHTPRDGVVGKLVYAGPAPIPSLSGDLSDPANVTAAIAAYQKLFSDWLLAAVAGLGNRAKGAILLIDTNMPPPLTVGALAEIVGTFYVQAKAGWQLEAWKKLWLVGFLPTPSLSSLHNAPSGIVYIVDGSAKAAAGNYAPFDSGLAATPALYVDRTVGAHLRNVAQSTPKVRFTMHARRTKTTSPSIVGIIPGTGATKKVLIGNTHSDGTNFAEENGGTGLLELARYATALRKHGKGFRHDLVLSFVTGHFNGAPTFPQTQGFVDDHPDLIKRATAAMTIEHLGCEEWVDDEHGYRRLKRPEFGVMYTDESLKGLTTASLKAQPLTGIGLARTSANLYFGVGGALQTSGVPSLSYLCGPTYLVATGAKDDRGCLEQFNPHLQRRQVAWFADLLHRLDKR